MEASHPGYDFDVIWYNIFPFVLQLTVGVIGHQETVFDKPMTPAEIQSVMYSTIQPYDIIQAVLQQEVVLYCGRLIATNPEMFKGILKIRVGYVKTCITIVRCWKLCKEELSEICLLHFVLGK
jgi:hypothetical protein